MTEAVTNNNQWPIGTIVSLKSHLFFNEKQFKTTNISGDPLMTPPLMVICEILVVRKSSYEADSGLVIQERGEFQYNCIWFSQKTFQFEECWFSSKLLKQISFSLTTPYSKPKTGDLVEFLTAPIEIKKRKSSLKIEGDSVNNKTHTITVEPSFFSPAMTVIGTNKVEIKDPLFDSKTNERIRIISNKLIKCKYYNPLSNKYSETQLPIEVLSEISLVNENTLNEVCSSISSEEYLLMKHKIEQDKIETHLLLPHKISHLNGHYYVKGFDYIKGMLIDIDINNITITRSLKTYFIRQLPDFKESKKGIQIDGISFDNVKNLIDEIGTDKFLRITYKKHNGETSTRTIKEYKLIPLDITYNGLPKEEGDQSKKNPDSENYLTGYCFLRNDTRHFRIDRITKILVLDYVEETAENN